MNSSDFNLVAAGTAISVLAYAWTKKTGKGLLGLDNKNACMFLAAISAIGGVTLAVGVYKKKIA